MVYSKVIVVSSIGYHKEGMLTLLRFIAKRGRLVEDVEEAGFRALK